MKSVVIGTAGHIDHGKSALVRALTGTDPDRLKEEKARGITIDLGFANFASNGLNLAFVDVPGHERFVKNMLAGAGGIDLVLLVVAADEGVMPQTREHFEICRLLRVGAGIVALTKSDLVDAEGLELARLDVRELVQESFLETAPVLAVSSKTGEGIDDLRSALLRLAQGTGRRSDAGAARLPIDRIFSMRGFGTVVTGTLVSGGIRRDTQLRLEPGGRTVGVRGLQVHGTARDQAVAGERVAANLTGIDVADAERGQELVAPGSFQPTTVADASVEVLAGARPVRHGMRVRFHQGTVEVLGRVAVIGPVAEGEQATIAPGSRAFVRLRLERPAVLTRGDRYILRAYSPPVTIAGGEILDPQPPRLRVRSPAALDRVRALDSTAAASNGRAAHVAELLIAEAGLAGFPASALVSRVGLSPERARSALEELLSAGRAVQAGEVLAGSAALNEARRAAVAAIEAHHRQQPTSEGMPREELRTRVFPRSSPAVFERVIEELAGSGVVAGRDRIRLATHQVALSAADQRACDAIERVLREAGLRPPDLAALAQAAGVSPGALTPLLQLLQRQRRVIRVEDLVFHPQTLESLKADVSAMKAGERGNATIDVATFKDRFSVTRKFAIPLLEYLDRERVTRRVGEKRTIL